MAIQESIDNVIDSPAPTPWPMLMALGLTLAFAGLVTNVAVTVVGGALFIAGAVGWFGEVLPAEHREAIRLETAPEAIVPHELGVDYLPVGEDRHRDPAASDLSILCRNQGRHCRRYRDGGPRRVSGNRVSRQSLVHDQYSRGDRDGKPRQR